MLIAKNPRETVAYPGLHQVLAADGGLVGDLPANLEPDLMRRMYRFMRLNRVIDDRMVAAQREGRIDFYRPCTGQEAPPVGTAAALRETDLVFPAFREGVVLLYRGFSLEAYVNQLFGNDGDVLKGRQMPGHHSDRGAGVVSRSTSIGSQVTQAVGAAWAARLRGTEQVVVAFMGDGATSSADFHTALNFAGVYRVPCVLVCQNNYWSMSVPSKRQTAARTLAEKAVAYGVPYARVDGNDVLAVFEAAREAAGRARTDEGPTFIEMVTYRVAAYSGEDEPTKYRDADEVDSWKERDPIDRFRRFLMDEKHWSDADETWLTTELEASMTTALTAAERRPRLLPTTIFEDVYATPPWHLREQAADHSDR